MNRATRELIIGGGVFVLVAAISVASFFLWRYLTWEFCYEDDVQREQRSIHERLEDLEYRVSELER